MDASGAHANQVWKAAAVLVALLASGFALGVAADRLLWAGRADIRQDMPNRRPGGGPPGGPGRMGPPPPERVVEHLSRELDLTEEQRAALATILQEEFDAVDALMAQTRPQLDAHHQRARARTLELLTPQQRVRMEDLRLPLGPPPGGHPPPHRGPPGGPPPRDGPPPHDGPPGHGPPGPRGTDPPGSQPMPPPR